MLSLGNTPPRTPRKTKKNIGNINCVFLSRGEVPKWSPTEAARGPTRGRHGLEKGWPPSGGLIWGPLAASWGLSSVFSLVSSLLSLLSSLFSLLSSLFSLLLAVVVLRGLDLLSFISSLLSALFPLLSLLLISQIVLRTCHFELCIRPSNPLPNSLFARLSALFSPLSILLVLVVLRGLDPFSSLISLASE